MASVRLCTWSLSKIRRLCPLTVSRVRAIGEAERRRVGMRGADIGAAALLGIDETFGAELLDGFAHRAARQAVLLAEFLFGGQPGAGRKLAREDLLAQEL